MIIKKMRCLSGQQIIDERLPSLFEGQGNVCVAVLGSGVCHIIVLVGYSME
ncbi:hypothetical protein [Desulfosarcina cetonica]|uniref:hypothetical protein n=1 Tax=Desulfosarcina cetonica TaxID=90730 RepID=UPI0012EE42B0|nr:hypothetical protein [Desulfosarcina cetonica]